MQPHKLTLARKILSLDWFLFLLVLALCTGGIMAIDSATISSERPDLQVAHQRQAMWMGLGLFGSILVGLIDYRWFIRFAWWFLGLGVLLLVAVLIVGEEINNSKSWFVIGGLSLQPAEFTKIFFIIFISWLLGREAAEVRTFKTFFFCCLTMGVFMLLILKQPDLGSAAVFVPICFAMMFVAGVSKRWLFLGAVLGLALGVAAFFTVLKPYQKNRLLTFLNEDLDPQGSGYHLKQSKIAIGSGGFSGKGWKQGTQNLLGFLPRDVSFSDFIFSVIGEEFGFIGSMALLGVFGCLLLFGLRIAGSARDMPGALLATGVTAMFFAHLFENIGMTIGVMPITGIPLPFISYGGTFVLACFFGIGLLQSVHVHRRQTL